MSYQGNPLSIVRILPHNAFETFRDQQMDSLTVTRYALWNITPRRMGDNNRGYFTFLAGYLDILGVGLGVIKSYEKVQEHVVSSSSAWASELLSLCF